VPGGDFLTDGQLEACANAVRAYHGGDAQIAKNAVLRSVKINHIGPDGHYTDPVTREFPFTEQGGSGAVSNWPLQCAVAVSLVTGLRGPRYRGRFYLPPLNTTGALGPDHRLVPSLTTRIAEQAAITLRLLAAQGFGTVVSSKFGTNTPVTAVRVGSVVDTLRSRRNQQLEAYTVEAL
jgi:hypothetical protein